MSAPLFALKAEIEKRRLEVGRKEPSVKQKSKRKRDKNEFDSGKEPNNKTKQKAADSQPDDWQLVSAKLEEKAKLYDKLQLGGETPGELKESLLVDFNLKLLPEGAELRRLLHEEKPVKISSDTELVEYIDGFGRKRMLTKSQIAEMEAEDEENAVSFEAPVGEPVKDVFFDHTKEIRNLGVGFVQLSADVEQRAEELASIKDLRAETVSEQRRTEAAKEQRARLVAARLQRIAEMKKA